MGEKFGGGLGRFRDGASCQNQNLCRELVEVEGGTDWRIRRLQEKYEDVCWKYPGSSVIVNYHMNRLQNLSFISECHPDENHKLFYAKVSNFVSPVEICLQPKYLRSARQGIYRQMNAFYNSNSTSIQFDDDNLFIGIACAAQEDGVWYRGKIVQISGDQHVVVEFVDIGIQHLISRQSIRPLIRRFGRAPPLSLKCRVEGVSINDLETKDLVEFKKIVESCNALFRVELKSRTEPFLIDLLHPTISGKHVCEKFMPPPENLKKIERLDRNWVQHCKKVFNEVDDDEDDVWNHHWSGDQQKEVEIEPVRVIRRLDKCQKAPRFENDKLIVGHIENSQIIYLHYPWQITTRQKIEDRIENSWNNFHSIPQNQIKEDHVYAIKYDEKEVTDYKRVVFINKKSLLLLDYGIYINKNLDEIELRLLPDEKVLNEPPMLTVISLAGASTLQPAHYSETSALREIMRSGDFVSFQWDGKSKNTPMRGLLYTKDQQNISIIMSQRLVQTRQIIECRQLVKYTPQFRNSSIISNYIYQNCCHHSYAKGTYETVDLII